MVGIASALRRLTEAGDLEGFRSYVEQSVFSVLGRYRRRGSKGERDL